MHGLALEAHYNELVPAEKTAEVTVVLTVDRTGPPAPGPVPADGADVGAGPGTGGGSAGPGPAANGAPAGAPAPPPEAGTAPLPRAQVLLLDCSDAMAADPAWADALRAGARAACEALSPGTAFAVVAGTERARPVYPADGTLATADPRTVAEAGAAVDALELGGGVAMGRWLAFAARLLDTHPNPLRHVLLVAAGANDDGEAEIGPVLESCRGRFSCDTRGVGRGWRASELRAIASSLTGSADMITDPVGRDRLLVEMRETVRDAMRRTLGNVLLEVRTRADVQLLRARQVAPTIERLTQVRGEDSGLSLCYGTGAWGEESRDYLFTLGAVPGPIGRSALLAQVVARLDTGDGPLRQLADCRVRVRWADPSDDAARRLDPRVEATGYVLPPGPEAEPDTPWEPPEGD